MDRQPLHFSRCAVVPTASSLAYQLGYLGEDGALIEFGDYDHAADRYWLRHAGIAKALWHRSCGLDTRLIGLSWVPSVERVFVSEHSDIQTPDDLRGRRIALPHDPKASFDMERAVLVKAYDAALRQVGLGLSDVILVDSIASRPKVQEKASDPEFFQRLTSQFAEQLDEGLIDAFSAPLPLDHARELGLRVIYDSRDDTHSFAGRELRALVASSAGIAERRETIIDLLAALLRAGAFAKVEPAMSMTMLGHDFQIDPAKLEARGIDPVALSRLSLTDEQLADVAEKQAMLQRVGMIEIETGIDTWVDRSLLQSAISLTT